MASLVPDGPWTELAESGRKLIANAMKIGPSQLPPDWVSLKAVPTPADGFPQEFGYNAIRIPLYLIRAGARDRAMLQAFQQNMVDAEGRVRLVDIKTGKTRQTLDDAGYRSIPALIGCVLDKSPFPEDAGNSCRRNTIRRRFICLSFPSRAGGIRNVCEAARS